MEKEFKYLMTTTPEPPLAGPPPPAPPPLFAAPEVLALIVNPFAITNALLPPPQSMYPIPPGKPGGHPCSGPN